MKLWLLLSVLLSTVQAFGYADHCSTSRAEGFVQSICRGGSIPVDRTRNFSNQRLECTTSSDNFIRRPQKFNFNDWSTNNQSGNDQLEEKAWSDRRKLPLIQWSGRIPYETVEHWDWQACELHQNGMECGTHEECHDTTERECDHNDKGEETNCHDVTKKVCEDVANYCYYDVTYSEAVHCSNEVMNYSGEFKRPSVQEWNRKKDGKVAEILPNKYDLLPGEVENVQTFNNSGSSTQLHPNAKILNNWNSYNVDYSGSGVGAQCLQDKTYDLHVAVRTEGRKMGKKGPNAFRLPVDMDGKSVDVFGGEWTQDSKGNKLRPAKLYLADSSAAMIESISEISRKASAREVQKVKSGNAGNRDGSSLDSGDSLSQSFFKSTVVKIALFKVNKWWWDRHVSYDVHTTDVKNVRASNNVLSSDQDVANADNYVFNLDSPNNVGENIYKHVLEGIRPDRVYDLQVSMYQKGVPFYNQSCADDSKRWRCLGYLGGWGVTPFNRESQYFSDPIHIKFETPKVETRGLLQRMNNFLNIDTLGPIGWIGEKIVHERTTGANK